MSKYSFTYKKIILVIYWVFATIFIYGQNNAEQEYIDIVTKAITKNISDYSELEKTFRYHKDDTLKMSFLEQKSKEANYFMGEAFATTMLGVYYRNKSRFNQATTYHNKALHLAIKSDNRELQVVNLNMLGVINRRLDNIRKALDYHQQALSVAENQVDSSTSLTKSIAVSLNSMGNIYLTLNQPDLALDRFNKSLSIEKKARNNLGLAINYQNIGYALEQKGELQMALNNYKTSLSYNESINSEVGRVICYNSIGQIYLKLNNPEIALKILYPTLNLALKLEDQFYITSSYIGLGWALTELNKIDEAEKHLLTGLGIAKKYKLKTSIADANMRLSVLNEIKGNYKLAHNQYIEADNIYHDIRNDKNTDYVNALTFQYETESKNNQIQALANENEIVKLKLKESKRNWFLVLAGIIILVLILLFINRQRRLRNEKQILTLEQDMLRSQMNPHFIFNSLNSIKLYIINNEKENAVYYLNKFSKLIRKILISSKEKEIPLSEELDTMKLYMNIENIRFSNEIDYTTKVAEDIDLEAIKVPSLILQPFLENALWHGLSTKKDNKEIQLEVTKNNDFVKISITDNGVGRIKADEIKQSKVLKRKSVGLTITNDRLANFYKSYEKDYSLNITDLYDNNKIASGTRVIINIPIEKNLKTA